MKKNRERKIMKQESENKIKKNKKQLNKVLLELLKEENREKN